MRYTSLIVLMPMLAVCATAEAKACQPVFASNDLSLIVNAVAIEPGGKTTQDFQVQVRNEAGASDGSDDEPEAIPSAASGGRCEATIRVARLGALAGPDFPPFVLSGPGNRQIRILPDPALASTSDSDVFLSNVPPGPQGRTVPFQISVPTDWGLRAGTYTDQLELLLIDHKGDVADQTTLTTTITIPSAVSLRLVGAVVGSGGRGPASVDLGDVSSSRETHSDNFGARIFSTAPYAVQFSSDNLGNLVHERGRGEIPYQLYFDGAVVNLSANSEIPYFSHTPRSGDRRSMHIVVPPVVAVAGRYSDRITITVSAM